MALSLPRFVAFKGSNGLYLCARPFQNRPSLQFAATDITDSTVVMEIVDAGDGNIRIKDTSSGKFWIVTNLNQNLVVADSTSTTNDNNRETLFRPFKVNSYTTTLLNLGNNQFCRRYTDGNLASGFTANYDFTGPPARLKVEEPVSWRNLYSFEYDLGKSRVYDNETVVLVEDSTTNRSDSSSRENLKLTYDDVQTFLWKTKLSLKFPSKDTFGVFKFPSVVVDGKVELVNQPNYFQDFELDETIITTFVKETTHEVVVPPRTKVVVTLTATRGMCDVPFTYSQEDTLHNGNSFTTEIEGDTYTGSCYYNLEFHTSQETIAG